MSRPTSPLLSVEEPLRWMKHRARHAGSLHAGRWKILAVAAICILLGYSLTSSLSEPTSSRVYQGHTSSSVLDGPPGFRSKESGQGKDDASAVYGFHGSSGAGDIPIPGPSIKGALSDLHHAVSGKINSWKESVTGKTGNGPGGSTGGVFTDMGSHNFTGGNGSYVSEEVVAPGRDLLGERMRVGKVTIIFGGAATYERAVRTHEAHDRIHGYPLYVLRHGILDDVWSKPAYILNLLLRELSKPEDERLQWLLWVDADTILLNPFVPIETFLPPSPEFDDVHMLVTADWNGLNNGVFPIRVNQWAVDLFAAIISFRHYKPDVSLTFRDQSAMDMLLKERKFAQHIVWAPQRWFNAYQGEHNETLAPFQVRRGDFLVHFAGVGDRDKRMAYWLDRVEQHLPDWEMEVQHTSYPGEAREFWTSQRALRADTSRSLEELRTQSNDMIQDTEDQVNEHNARLQGDEANILMDRVKALREKMEKDSSFEEIKEAFDALTKARTPLETITADADQAFLKAAHNAIFAAEKTILSQPDESKPEVVKLRETASRLKSLILQPKLSKSDVTKAVDEIRSIEGKLEQQQAASVASAVALLAAEDKAKSAPVADRPAASNAVELLPAFSSAAIVDSEGGAMMIEGVIMTHTQTSMHTTTHIAWVTATIVPDANR